MILGMKLAEYNERLLDEFERVVAEHGRGTVARLQRKMGVSRSYFRQWRHGTPVRVEKLLEALEILGVEPFVFYARALLPEDISSFELDVLLIGRKSGKKAAPRTEEGKLAVELLSRRDQA